MHLISTLHITDTSGILRRKFIKKNIGWGEGGPFREYTEEEEDRAWWVGNWRGYLDGEGRGAVGAVGVDI